jgi:hypothetical protein
LVEALALIRIKSLSLSLISPHKYKFYSTKR